MLCCILEESCCRSRLIAIEYLRSRFDWSVVRGCWRHVGYVSGTRLILAEADKLIERENEILAYVFDIQLEVTQHF
jgi:hypothetical protein